MSFRVCIPTAGTGSRLGDATRFLNKSLVAIANRPTLSHLIEQFPADTEFVIALGHKGHLVRQFLELAYPERAFFFAEVTPFEGPGSGLGLSLLACREFLQQPFVFLSCDTLVREPVPAPTHNWLGWADTPVGTDLAQYRTVAVEGGAALALCEKGEGRPGSHHAYIGLAGIHDHAAFWRAMDAGGADTVNTGEAQGLRALLAHPLNTALGTATNTTQAYRFTWFDTGNPTALETARAAYRQPDEPNILPKANEAIWFVGDRVIKFSDDEKFIAHRARRVQQIAEFVPTLQGVRTNMYSYGLVQGQVLSDAVDLPTFERFLGQCRHFWQPAVLNGEEAQAFRQTCMAFYKAKTLERVALYYKNFGTEDGCESLNGEPAPTLAALLAEVDWDGLADGLPGRFHGDFHFENIVVSQDVSQGSQRFTFLDWRQDFGGSLTVGDVYYDLAKLLHGLIVSHELIAADHFHSQRDAQAIRYDFHRKQVLVACEHRFLAWVTEQGYDAHKVQVLTALIYLNIAALHHDPYCHLLYALGKHMLLNLQRPANAAR